MLALLLQLDRRRRRRDVLPEMRTPEAQQMLRKRDMRVVRRMQYGRRLLPP